MTAQASPSDGLERLTQVLVASHTDGGFNKDAFFRGWFRERDGGSFQFVFRKNLAVTNIQYAELFALLRIHTTCPAADTGELEFISGGEFQTLVEELVSGFRIGDGDVQARCQLLAELYGPMLRRLVVVDALFGSCGIHLAPGLEVDLAAVCAESGYISLCGRSVYYRPTDKATADELVKRLGRYLDVYPPDEGDRRIPFVIYNHEDFTAYDRELADDLREGLDDLKMHVEKFYMGGKTMVSLTDAIKAALDDRLYVEVAGDYRDSRAHQRKKDDGLDPARTIWLIVDRGIPIADGRHAGRYYVAYDQLYRNENPMSYFDENMPGWINHTTIPHTLAAAMINISRPHWHGNVTVQDPFVGSGTFFLEALRLGAHRVSGSDKLDIADQLIKDNLQFFSLPSKELNALKSSLDLVVGRLVGTKDTASQLDSDGYLTGGMEFDDDYNAALKFRRSLGEDPVQDVPPDRLPALAAMPVRQKLFFYILLRAEVRSLGSLTRGTTNTHAAVAREAEKLARSIQKFFEQRLAEETKVLDQRESFQIVSGSYSHVTSPNLTGWTALAHQAAPLTLVKDMHVDDLETAQVLVADPPYGFNTDEPVDGMARLYARSIEKMVKVAAPSGQLVLCLADVSHTGRESHYVTHKELVSQQVFTAARKFGMEVVNTAAARPHPSHLLGAPYYWESVRALRRVILHFRFREVVS
ncbi:MAG: hypothetical protein JWP14_879 [Frankiales bacterium]|nr:hypothetical protein [Frankiales bacterium]